MMYRSRYRNLLDEIAQDSDDSLCLCIPMWAQDKFRNLVAIGWAKRDVDVLATAPAHKGNQTLSSPLSMIPSKKTVCVIAVVLAQWFGPVVRVGTSWAWLQYKIHQT